MSANLSNRKILVEFMMNSQTPDELKFERSDLLEVLKQWQTGTLNGFASCVPSIDFARPSSAITNLQS